MTTIAHCGKIKSSKEIFNVFNNRFEGDLLRSWCYDSVHRYGLGVPMIRVLLLFVILTAIVWLGIIGVQKMTGKQALDLTKTAVYAIISSTVAIALMFMLVVLF